MASKRLNPQEPEVEEKVFDDIREQLGEDEE